MRGWGLGGKESSICGDEACTPMLGLLVVRMTFADRQTDGRLSYGRTSIRIPSILQLSSSLGLEDFPTFDHWEDKYRHVASTRSA